MEFGGLGLGCACHTGQLFIHTEVVLNRDRGVGAGLAFDHDVFFGLDCLMQAVGPAATGHDAARVFIDDHDLAVGDDVFDVFFVEGIGAEELRNRVDFF